MLHSSFFFHCVTSVAKLSSAPIPSYLDIPISSLGLLIETLNLKCDLL